MKGILWKGSFAVLTLAVALVLGACEKELPDNKLSGKSVLVRVRLVGVAEGGKKDVTRSSSMREKEEVTVPVGDGMLLEMRMEQDSSMLRAGTTTLDGNAYFRVVALIHSTTTFISYGDFTIDDGCVAGGLHVPDGDSYDFVCYSYNSSSPLDALAYKQGDNIANTVTIDAAQGTNDLLYKKIENIPVSGSAPELDILLGRVMARVKVIINCEYYGWALKSIANTITIGSEYGGGKIKLTDGVVTDRTGEATVTWPTLAGTNQEEESNPVVVMPKESGSTITVNIPAGAIERQGLTGFIPGGTSTGTFSATVVPGNSYSLYLRLRTPIWARSNIYWQEVTDDQDPKYPGYLTFEPAADDPVNNDDTKAGYQGVYFKWGSLVGIASNNDYHNWRNVPIYKPVVKDPLTTSTWATTTEVWDDIPYMKITVGTPGRDNTTAIDAEQNNLATYQTLLGDICQYLSTKTGVVSGDYRLPTSMEFGADDTDC